MRMKPRFGTRPYDSNHWARQGLTAHYIINEGGGNKAYDVGSGNYTSTFQTTTLAWTTGRKGNALSLNGTSDYLTNTNFNSSHGLYPVTLTGWSSMSGFGGTFSPILWVGTSFNRYYTIGWSGGSTRWGSLAARNTVFQSLADSASQPADKWTMITGVFKSATERLLYVDGVYIGTDTTSVNEVTTADTIRIGWAGGALRLGGLVDNVRFYSRDLTDSEILELYWNEYPEWTDRIWAGAVAAGGANAPTGHIYGPLVGALGGAI